MTPEQIAKLPKWAQDHIKKIERERDIAVRELNEWCDSQTPSKVRIDELVVTGEERGPSHKVRYVQTERATFTHSGVELDVSVFRDGEISLQWSAEDSHGDVAMIPESGNRVRLVSKQNMR